MARNHLLWISPLVAFLGFASYWRIFYRWPVVNDVPWVNLVILALAVGLSLAALRRAWAQGLWMRVAGLGGVLWAGALSVVLVLYCAVWSFDLPDPMAGLALGAEAPGIVLLDQEGRGLDLREAGADLLVLIFLRGHW